VVVRVLMVEDESCYADPLAFLLGREGFEVVIADTGAGALAEFDRRGADIVLLDLMLPGMSGAQVGTALRARAAVPVIVVSALDGEADKVAGLGWGADDYITKPYSARELVARVRAVLRRCGQGLAPGPVGRVGPAAVVLRAGPVRMDLDRHVVTVTHPGGSGGPVRLALKEFDLLECLLRHPGRVLTRAELMDRVWGSDDLGDSKSLEVHIKRLRAKLEADPAAPRHLLTVRGLGYKFET